MRRDGGRKRGERQMNRTRRLNLKYREHKLFGHQKEPCSSYRREVYDKVVHQLRLAPEIQYRIKAKETKYDTILSLTLPCPSLLSIPPYVLTPYQSGLYITASTSHPSFLASCATPSIFFSNCPTYIATSDISTPA